MCLCMHHHLSEIIMFIRRGVLLLLMASPMAMASLRGGADMMSSEVSKSS